MTHRPISATMTSSTMNVTVATPARVEARWTRSNVRRRRREHQTSPTCAAAPPPRVGRPGRRGALRRAYGHAAPYACGRAVVSATFTRRPPPSRHELELRGLALDPRPHQAADPEVRPGPRRQDRGQDER